MSKFLMSDNWYKCLIIGTAQAFKISHNISDDIFEKGVQILLKEEKLSSMYKHLGLNVLYYRKLNGFTQKELAKRAGLSCAQISYIERGRGSCKINSLFSIANALKLDITLLFN